jgi:hypothetical protein
VSAADHGGPAFPVTEVFDDRRGEVTQYGSTGMTLRDYLAVNCDIGNVDELTVSVGGRLLGRSLPDIVSDAQGALRWWADYRAALRYIEADAMLKARAL